MSKTPEELAVEFSRFDPATDIGTDLGSYRQGLFEGFIAGYKAAQDQFRSTTREAGDKLTPTGWISVKDRLPEENEEVLVFGNILNAPKLLGVRYRVLGDQDWKYSWQGDGYIYKQDYVTHWQPLPAPPKEEK